MAKKRDRAFFVCPRWQEAAAGPRASGAPIELDLHPKTLAAIQEGRPVARSTLRKALRLVGRSSGTMLDVDEFIVDQRATRSRP